ncbi:MAG: hypothetical protein AAF223_04635 [Bacteroidota bacterium]
MIPKVYVSALLFSAILLGLLSACQSSKVAYGNSYYFKATPKAVVKEPLLSASVEKNVPTQTTAAEHEQAIEQRVIDLQQQQKTLELLEEKRAQPLAAREQRELRRQQRNERKAFRKELKQLAQDIKMAPDRTQKEQLSSNGRLGLILAVIGLLVLLLVPGQVGYVIGVIALVIGLLLLILDLV